MDLSTSPPRLALGVVAIVVLDALLLFGLAHVFDTWSFDEAELVAAAAIVVGLANGLALFAFSRLPLELGVLATGAVLVAINVIAIAVGGALFAGSIAIAGAVYTGVLGSLTTLLLAWFIASDEA